ncbi:MAG: protease modulator HflK [Planctomycetales bacterium]
MKRLGVGIGLLLLAYLASGLFIVRGNEQALVRRFGKARFPLAASGLHWDLPWPFTRLDRVNVHQLQTIAIGLPSVEPIESSGFLREANVERQGEFLTGDKNVLHLSVSVQYRIADPYAWLCEGSSPQAALKLLVESLVTDAVARSGVDYVHPLGMAELRELLTRRAREATGNHPWGAAIEEVTIAGALPPVEVKGAFLDVSNARAERDRTIHQEQARAEKSLSAARATAGQLVDRAETWRHARGELARGAADRFRSQIAEFHRHPESGPASVNQARRQTMQRLFTSTLEELLPRLAGKVFLDQGDAVDLMMFQPPESRNNPSRAP